MLPPAFVCFFFLLLEDLAALIGLFGYGWVAGIDLKELEVVNEAVLTRITCIYLLHILFSAIFTPLPWVKFASLTAKNALTLSLLHLSHIVNRTGKTKANLNYCEVYI